MSTNNFMNNLNNFMTQLGITEYKPNVTNSPGYRRAIDTINNVDLNQERLNNNQLRMLNRLEQYEERDKQRLRDIEQRMSTKQGTSPAQNKSVTPKQLIKKNVEADLNNLWRTGQNVVDGVVDDAAKGAAGALRANAAKTPGLFSKIASGARGLVGGPIGLATLAGLGLEQLANGQIGRNIGQWFVDNFTPQGGNPNDMIRQRNAEEIQNSGTNLRAQGKTQDVGSVARDYSQSTPRTNKTNTTQPNKTNTAQTTSGDENLPSRRGSVEQFILDNADPSVTYGRDPVTNEVVAVPLDALPPDSPVVTDNNNGNNTNGTAGVPPVSADGGEPIYPTPGQPLVADVKFNDDGSAVADGRVVEQPAQQGVPANNSDMDLQNLVREVMSAQPMRDTATRDLLSQYYNDIQQMISANPHYQGSVQTPNNPYNVDPRQLEALTWMDQVQAAIGGGRGDRAQAYIDGQRQLYQQRMANQLGVPYEDYIRSTITQQEQNIALRSKQLENELAIRAQESEDMATRLSALQELVKLREDTNRALDEIRLRGEYDLAQERLSQAGQDARAALDANTQLIDRQMQINDPNQRLRAQAQFYNSVGFLDPNVQRAFIMGMPADMRAILFNPTATQDDIEQLFNWARTQPGGPGIIQQIISNILPNSR